MPAPQNYRNHARFDPPFHYFAAPVLLLNVLFSLGVLIHRWPEDVWLHAWLLIVSLALLLTVGLARSYPLKVQDRVIRLEERLRYGQLLTPEALASAQALSLRQIVALRFASDAELPALLHRAVTENLPPKAIKEAITVWRPDTERV